MITCSNSLPICSWGWLQFMQRLHAWFLLCNAFPELCFAFTSAVELGKQVRSAIRIKSSTKSHVAFKFQTTKPKSCFMRPLGAILSPGESIIAMVFKFVEYPENDEKPQDQKCKFDEQKEEAVVEQVLRVVFLDVQQPCPQ
ncbi:vesicle-associated protein 4-2-like [Iris pallida]|uniref:Vesicle-associated protein 4-2-like n=1 Tax=Iris pallida TaxID=29817 RepID=A0AAX6GTT2_IRIPA|nr:vesicle-associated protein 4-2-like [Iris pallida]